MKYTAGMLRSVLFSMIRGMGETPERYAREPGRDFTRQRQKLLPLAFEELFRRFTDFLHPQKRFKGYRLLAVDGSSLKSPSYPKDTDSHRPGTEHQHGWNLHHINALFDLVNGIYNRFAGSKRAHKK